MTPYESTIGNAAEFIYYGAMVAKMKGKTLVLIVRQPGLARKILSKIIKTRITITNKEIFNVFSNNIIPADRPITKVLGVIVEYYMIVLFIYNQILRPVNYVLKRLFNKKASYFPSMPWLGHKEIFNPTKDKQFFWNRAISCDWEKVLSEEMPIYLDEKKIKKAKELQAEMGMPEDCWFVALHVREKGFYNEIAAEVDFRCGNIYSYLKAIDLVTSMGGWVVRMGDKTMTPLPKIEHVIDYPHTKYKSDFMDLYLIKNCRLYVGMDSGIWDVAHMFKKNNLVINSAGGFFCIPPKYGDLIIIKHYYSRSKMRFLSVKELLDEPWGINIAWDESPYNPEKSEYLVVDNTPDEIRTVIYEWFNKSENNTYTTLQNLFIEKRRQQIIKWLAEAPYFKKYPDQAYRFASRYCYEGTAGNDFLEKNWEYGHYLTELTDRFRKMGRI